MFDKSKMSGFIGALGLLCCVGVSHSQENYASWAKHAPIVLNTSFTGANVYNDVHNFPVLIRLDKSNFTGFGQLLYQGTKPIDIRFSKSSDITKHFPYQIEYWSPTKDTLAIWVLVDTISGGNDQQTITMHYGMTGVYDSSNGAKVFDVANGYLGVWHLADTSDATANGYSATNTTGLPTDTIGMIGHGRYFANQEYLQMGDATSKISSAVIPFGGPWTLSAWVFLDPSATTQLAVAGAGDAGYQIQRQTNGGGQYSMTDYGPGGTGTTGGYMEAFASSSVSSLGTWHHLVAVRDNSVGTSPYYAESLYVDGYLAGGSVGINQHTQARNQSPFCIAKQGDASGHFLTGIVDEVEMSSVARSSDWAALSFQNQQAAQTLVSLPPLTAVKPTTSLQAGAFEFSLKGSIIGYTLPTAGSMELSICDMLGRTAMSSSRMQNAGHYTVDLKSSPLAAGKYTVRFKAGNLEKHAVMLLTR